MKLSDPTVLNTAEDSWPPPPEHLSPGPAEVHVWRASLRQSETTVERLLHTLARDEQERAARFHFQKDHDGFVVARGALREILGRCLRVEPAQLRFSYSSYGKPALIAAPGWPDLHFNVSHSHELALLAVAQGRTLGVDIEFLRPAVADGEVAERFFSAYEVARLRALPAAQQTRAFFNCWTRKEAYIKARGEGLSWPLSQFDVSLAPEEPVAILCTRGDPQEAARWSLQELRPAADYAAALVAQGQDWQLYRWQWTADR